MLYDVKTQKWRQLNTTPDFFGYLAGLKTALCLFRHRVERR
jgi:hypothetical protein